MLNSAQRTYVDHDCLLAELVEGHGGIDSTPVELDRTANAVDTASEDNDAMVVEGNIVRGGVVRGVQVVRVRGEPIAQVVSVCLTESLFPDVSLCR